MNLKLFTAVLLLMVVIVSGCSKKSSATANLPEATMAELNRAYAQWEMISVGPPPKTVEGLTNSYLLRGKRLPAPPPGKKLVLDPARRQVMFADQ
jgi:hypothetical protein